MDVSPEKVLEIPLGDFFVFYFHSHNKAENAVGCAGRFETKKATTRLTSVVAVCMQIVSG